MDIELLEIRDFVGDHPPFDRLPPEALDRLTRAMSIRYFLRGVPFPPDEEKGRYLYVLRKGAVAVRNGRDQLVAKLGEGDIYLPACSDASTGISGITAEDTLCYLVPCKRLDALRRMYPDFDKYFSEPVAEKLRRALGTLAAWPMYSVPPLTAEVSSLVRRSPVSISPRTSIQQAAEIMTRERVSSLLIMEGTRLEGIVTDRDLRSRCVARGLSYEATVNHIMSTRLHKIPAGTTGLEALLIMMRQNVHHLPVLERGLVTGVLSVTDIVRHQSAGAIYLISDIRKSEDLKTLTDLAGRLGELQVQMMSAGATAHHLGQAVSTITDAITSRLIEQARENLGPEPIPYAWVSCGSQARQEQTAQTDQDNALLLSDEYGPEHEAYFEALARFVCDGLDACGIRYCPGDVMASNPRWRQSYRKWRAYFDDWITAPDRSALLHASIFFDMRAVHGQESLLDRLRSHVLEHTRGNGIFLAHLAAAALTHRPPLGFFRNFVLVHNGEHDHTLDLKHRSVIPVVDLARVYALSSGLPEVNSMDRLKAACEALVLSQDGSANLQDALELIATLRARHQAQQIKRGMKPDNFLDPTVLSRLERGHLKDAFAVIRTQQDALEQSYQTARFF